jgi:hypothetical protein
MVSHARYVEPNIDLFGRTSGQFHSLNFLGLKTIVAFLAVDGLVFIIAIPDFSVKLDLAGTVLNSTEYGYVVIFINEVSNGYRLFIGLFLDVDQLIFGYYVLNTLTLS